MTVGSLYCLTAVVCGYTMGVQVGFSDARYVDGPAPARVGHFLWAKKSPRPSVTSEVASRVATLRFKYITLFIGRKDRRKEGGLEDVLPIAVLLCLPIILVNLTTSEIKAHIMASDTD